jgi:hypothetical protein
LDRKNDTKGGGYFGRKLFDYGSQHFENEALNKLYTFAQRAFYRKLAPAYRRNPEMTIAVEPNHENEIVSGSNSIGDYNPENLQGFYHYLKSLYGNLIQINKILKTVFSGNGSNTTELSSPDGLEPVTGNACWLDFLPK